MTERRLIIQSGDANVARYLDRAQPFHEAYALACGADFRRFDGVWPGAPAPAWNRLPMILAAFDEGYERVLWLDADTLVVQPDIDVFRLATVDHDSRYRAHVLEDGESWRHAPFVMRRTAGGFYWPMDGADQWEGWNDGVLLVNRSETADAAVSSLWVKRDDAPLPHHQPGLWELNWVLDYVKANPLAVAEMDQRFNWQPFNGATPEQYAVIKAWHGLPHSERWEQLDATARALEVGASPVGNVRDTTPGFVGT